MFTVMKRLALAGALVVGSVGAGVGATGCGGGGAEVKTGKHDPKKKEAKAQVVEARDAASSGNYDEADRLYAEASSTASESPKLVYEIMVEWVDMLIHAGRATRATAIAQQYNGNHLEDQNGYDVLAGAWLAANKPKDALDIASQLIALNGENPAGHEKRGRALIALNQNDEGLDELRKAVQLAPDNAKYHIALGDALHDLGDANKAALELRAALKAAPNDPEAHALLGAALRDQDELDEAKQHFDKALELDPKNGTAYFELGVLYNRQAAALTGDKAEKKQAEAQEALGKAVKYSPSESRYWYAYGEIYRVQQHIDEALSAYHKAVDVDPPYPKAIAKLGGMYFEKKNYDEAEKYLTQAVRKDDHNAVAYWYLARVYAATKRPRAAIENFDLYLKYAPKEDPNREKARDLRDLLKRR